MGNMAAELTVLQSWAPGVVIIAVKTFSLGNFEFVKKWQLALIVAIGSKRRIFKMLNRSQRVHNPVLLHVVSVQLFLEHLFSLSSA